MLVLAPSMFWAVSDAITVSSFACNFPNRPVTAPVVLTIVAEGYS